MRKIIRFDSGYLYVMKVLKKVTLKGEWRVFSYVEFRLGIGIEGRV